MSEPFVITIAPLDPNSSTPRMTAIARPVEGLHPEHPIAEPPLGIWGPNDPRPTPPIYLPSFPPHPTHPIVIPPPPDPSNGLPTHPIYIPGYPAHPIVFPPSIWGPNDPRPTPPIVIPPSNVVPGRPAHPIVLPPEIWPGPGQPAHPIVIPPIPPLFPEYCPCPPQVDNTLPGSQPRPDQGLPGDQPRPDQGLPGWQPRPSHPIAPGGPDMPPAVPER
jgi:hypothetical protein